MILFYFYHPIVKYTKQPCIKKKKKKKKKKERRRKTEEAFLFVFYKISLKVQHGEDH